MADESLTSKTKRAVLWSSIDRFGSQGVQFIFGIILARLLSPNDYGVIAMPLVFLALAQCFIDSGFANALIRKQGVTEEDLSTTFYFNVIVGVVCYCLLYAISPLVASFYNMSILNDLLKVTSLTIIFNTLSIVQQTILTRKIDFKTQTIVSFSSQLVTGFIGLYMALNGYGVWALVAQQTGGALLRTILLWIFGRWYPKTKWSYTSFKYLWNFGSKLLTSNIIYTLYSNIYPIVIGKVYNPTDLGNYTRAQNFSQFPSASLTGVLQRVTFPILSSIQNDEERLVKNYRRVLGVSVFIIFPLMLGLSAVANPFIRLVLGDEWLGAIPLLQILSFNMMWYPVHSINLNMFSIKGRTDINLKLEILNKCIGIPILVVFIPLGVKWLVLSSVIIALLTLLLNMFYISKMNFIDMKKQILDLVPVTMCSMLMWAIVIVVCSYISNSFLSLIIGLLLGFMTYLVLSYVFMKDTLFDVISLFPNSISSKFLFNKR